MKKTVFCLAAAIVCGLFLNIAHAQSAPKNAYGVDYTAFVEVAVPFGNSTTIEAGSENLNTISAKAVRDFGKNYKNATDAKWFQISNGFIARFSENNIETMAAYNTKGKWEFTISHYDESKLPESVKRAVKSIYYDFQITLAEEIHTSDKTMYV